ncbi:MAG: hydrogen gas-evolving membrane-bound hydrogenase subunit E [Desulfobacterales bacterium]
MKAIQILVLVAFAALLMVAAVHLPRRGDPNSPANRAENVLKRPVAGAYYIQNAYLDAKTPNMVTVILADYRGFDTLGETVVVFAGGVACLYLLRRRTA